MLPWFKRKHRESDEESYEEYTCYLVETEKEKELKSILESELKCYAWYYKSAEVLGEVLGKEVLLVCFPVKSRDEVEDVFKKKNLKIDVSLKNAI